jgi:hypothetical protein
MAGDRHSSEHGDAGVHVGEPVAATNWIDHNIACPGGSFCSRRSYTRWRPSAWQGRGGAPRRKRASSVARAAWRAGSVAQHVPATAAASIRANENDALITKPTRMLLIDRHQLHTARSQLRGSIVMTRIRAVRCAPYTLLVYST